MSKLWMVLLLLFVGCDGPNPLSRVVSRDVSGAAAPPPAGADLPVRMASSWGQTLNRAGTVPGNGFRAFYFDRRTPTAVVHSDSVPAVAIKYAWADFHDIDSPNFGAYWVGRVTMDTRKTYQVSVSQSWAKSRVFIDGRIVFDSSSSGNFSHSFDPGEHIIEVEYANNWHTTEFKVTLQDEATTQRLGLGDLPGLIARSALRSAKVDYVGVYESSATDTKIDVLPAPSRRPTVLWLSSYEAVDWQVARGGEIGLVVVTSYSPGSRVAGVESERVVYLDRSARTPSLYSLGSRCSCHAGRSHCEQKTDLIDLASYFQSTVGLPLGGFAVEYSASTMRAAPWDYRRAQVARREREANVRTQQQCIKSGTPDFDDLMPRKD